MPQIKVNFGPKVGGAGKKVFPPPKKDASPAKSALAKVNKTPPKEDPPKADPPKADPPKVEPPKEEPAPAKPTGKAPKLVEALEKEYKVNAGKTVIIDCVVEGEPEPDVDWYLNSDVIKDEGRFRYIFEKDDVIGLEIRKVTSDDAGEYRCRCFNKSGEVETKTKLVVKGEDKPAPKAEPTKSVDSAALKKGTFTPKKTKKKTKLPVERKGIKAENPEKYYEFGDEIGRGKFSVVRQATSKKDGSKYAAKIIKFDSDSLKFAIREYDLMVGGRLDNKGTVKLHEAYLVRKYLILIMELADGKTLLDKVSKMHSITEDDIASFIRQICEILVEFKKHNVIHLDIRPTNIRFVNGRDLKLLDYNSARHIANKKAGEVVDVIGDTEFCAPEMLNFEPVGPGSDMWSVAVITYILLSGISPFYYEDEDKVIQCVQRVKWTFDTNAFENISIEAKDFIKKCFVRIPEMRITAEDALEHKWLSPEYQAVRKRIIISAQDEMAETDERLYSEEEEDYIEASLVFRTFDEEEYESPEESDEEDEE